MKKMDKNNGFTLIELLIAFAIIGLITSLAVINVRESLARARDTKRIDDFYQIIKGMQSYNLEKGYYPGEDTGIQLALFDPDCNNLPIKKLQEANYMRDIPLDPYIDYMDTCDNAIIRDNPDYDNLFFYAWDLNSGLDACVSINRIETEWGMDILRQKYGTARRATGPGMNLNDADFSYCLEDEDYYTP